MNRHAEFIPRPCKYRLQLLDIPSKNNYYSNSKILHNKSIHISNILIVHL